MLDRLTQDSFDFGQSDEDDKKNAALPKKIGGIKLDKPGLATTNVWANKNDQAGRPGTSGLQSKEK